jgi:LuxR family transcriptional regulator, quorum-sensing system regulator BjaR1
MLTNSAFEFIEEIDKHVDAPSLVASFQDLIGKYGLYYVMIGDPRPPPARNDYLWATTWPSGWLDRWTSRNYLQVDPVVRKIKMQNRPLRWSRVQPNSGDPGSHILSEAGEFGMNDGLAVPVFSRDGLCVVVSMAAERYDIKPTDEAGLHLASIYFQGRLEHIRSRSSLPMRGPKLTPRERECLSWVAAGKTDWEISQILNIAEQTVHEYVQNALIKLNATTRAQAVAIAMANKLISA